MTLLCDALDVQPILKRFDKSSKRMAEPRKEGAHGPRTGTCPLALVDVAKFFGSVRALRGLSLELHAGEIHAQRAGVAVIHQEPTLFPDLSVARTSSSDVTPAPVRGPSTGSAAWRPRTSTEPVRPWPRPRSMLVGRSRWHPCSRICREDPTRGWSCSRRSSTWPDRRPPQRPVLPRHTPAWGTGVRPRSGDQALAMSPSPAPRRRKR